MLLANHGPVVSAATFRAAVLVAEELEGTGRLVLLTREMHLRAIPETEVTALAHHLEIASSPTTRPPCSPSTAPRSRRPTA